MSGHSASGSVSSGVVGITSTAELGSLLEIENDPILRLQLKNWEEQAKSISRRIERKENRTYAVKNEVYQLLGFYLVFQGVVLTAVAQASVLTCEEWWSPFILSSMTSIIAIVGVYQKLQSLHDVEENLREEKISYQVLSRNIQLFKRKGRSFDFVADVRRGEQPSGTAASSSSSRTQSFSFRSAALQLLSVVFSPNFVVFSCLAVFSVVVIISCNTILCKVSNG
ncbi:unnamed protein product [Sphagnum troendelagicum]|uniref:SMODS and SLOG-associating 2TM effector domain-containing protein n=1 Tax=Sphagnum troendelagicum TaxID=128251 RepID=A0ABP0UGB5_9BRYO